MGSKLIDIEIPVANKANVIHTHLIPSIRNLEPVKDFVRLVLNLNGPITKRELLQICGTCRRHRIQFVYKNFSYNFQKGKADNLIIRRDTHSIVEDHAPFFLFTDDDVFITKEWCKDLLVSLFYMIKYPTIGMVSIAYISKNDKGIFYPIKPSNSIWTGGGILFRNIEEWNDIVPEKYTHMFGCNVDNLLAFARWMEGYCAYRCKNKSYEHLRSNIEAENELAGFTYFKWNETLEDENSISKFLFQYKDEQTYANSHFRDELFPNVKFPVGIQNYSKKTLQELKKQVWAAQEK